MLSSLADRSPGAQVHLHIMDATDLELAATAASLQMLPLKIAVTGEQPWVNRTNSKTARCYYHAIRFIRFYHHLKVYGRTLWLMDVDALFHRDPREMFGVLGAADVAMRIRPGRLEPWNQFNACVVAATPKPESLRYFHLIAAYIADYHSRDRLRWGIDQAAMYGVFADLEDRGTAPSLALLDDRVIDYEYRDDGFVWCNSGKNKFAQVKRLADGSVVIDDPDRSRYTALLSKYVR